MASSTQQVLAAAADAAGGSPVAGPGPVGLSGGAIIALVTSVATLALQFIIRTIALGRWQGGVDARVAGAEARAAELSERIDCVEGALAERINQVKEEVIGALEAAEERQRRSLEQLEARHAREREEIVTELRALRAHFGARPRG